MFPTLALAAALALSPAQAPAKLNLVNVRASHGLIGPTRVSTKFLPGDILYIGFEIDGVTIGKDGKVVYTMTTEVSEKGGKILNKSDPAERAEFTQLGGGKIPCVAFVLIGVDLGPGEYSVKLTATDVPSKATGSFDFKFEVLKPDFGIVLVYATSDMEGRTPTHTTGFVGQFLWIHFSATGFQRDKAKKNQPNLKFEMTTLDEKGNPTLGEPRTVEINEFDEKLPHFPMRMNIPLTRTGKFTVRLKVTDSVANKTAVFELPVTVLPVEK